MYIATTLCLDNNPQDLLYSIKGKLSTYLGFQKIGILFYDSKGD